MAKVKFNNTRLSSISPVGPIGQARSHRYRDLLGVLWENRKEIPYAWNVLKHGVCDGCSLGPYGLRDNVVAGMHLCMIRLKQLKLNTIAALDISVLRDVERLRQMRPEQLRALGRLPCPMIRRARERSFLRVTWEEALGLVCEAIHDTAPHEMAFFATSRGLTNEVYYVLQKLARVLGTNNVGLCSHAHHSAGDTGLKATLGIGAPTCSLSDFIGTDLLIVFGANLAKNQPVATKYLRLAKKAGARIVVINPMREAGRDRYRAPSVASSAFFGTRLTDEFFPVRVGGDIAFINGTIKTMIATGQTNQAYVKKHTAGFAELKELIEQQSWEMLEQRSGLSRDQMRRFADLYGQAKNAVLVYGVGLTQHEFGIDNVKAIVNLALSRGVFGREKCGIMPIRGDSGVQGAGECGFEPDLFPGGVSVNDDTARRFSNLWYHPIPSKPGLKVPAMIEAAYRGEIKFLYSIGGNLYETTPDSQLVTSALSKARLRVHQGLMLDPSMLLDAEQAVVLLPEQTRYEQRSGGTTTSTERRIRFTPEIPGHPIGESWPGWEIPVQIGRRSMPNGDKLFPFDDTQSIREEMSRVMPIYQGIEKLHKEGDHLQWGGPFLFKDGFTGMPNDRAHFTPIDPPECRTEHPHGFAD
jgi:molybdopterin-dependent oxidoreductase alpha subunit